MPNILIPFRIVYDVDVHLDDAPQMYVSDEHGAHIAVVLCDSMQKNMCKAIKEN